MWLLRALWVNEIDSVGGWSSFESHIKVEGSQDLIMIAADSLLRNKEVHLLNPAPGY